MKHKERNTGAEKANRTQGHRYTANTQRGTKQTKTQGEPNKQIAELIISKLTHSVN